MLESRVLSPSPFLFKKIHTVNEKQKSVEQSLFIKPPPAFLLPPPPPFHSHKNPFFFQPEKMFYEYLMEGCQREKNRQTISAHCLPSSLSFCVSSMSFVTAFFFLPQAVSLYSLRFLLKFFVICILL